jgi:hypothetical protein
VNPEVLRIRDLDSFWEVGIEPEIQRLRQETYSKRRLEMMKIVRKERKKLVNQEQAANDAGGGSSLTPAQILAQQQKQNSTLVEIEERRLAKMRRRQEKELEQMLQFEVKMNDIQEEMKRKTEKEKRAEEKRIRDKEKRLRAMAEERRIRELRRKAAEDAEEEMRREMQEEMFQRDMTTLAEKKRNDRKAKVQGRINDEERARHQEEHRLMTQRLFKEQQDTLMTKAGERARKEKIRMAKVEAKRKIDGQRYAGYWGGSSRKGEGCRGETPRTPLQPAMSTQSRKGEGCRGETPRTPLQPAMSHMCSAARALDCTRALPTNSSFLPARSLARSQVQGEAARG